MRVAGILRDNSKNWWYHRDLRKAGCIAEAMKREHCSVRSDVSALRKAKENGGYLHIGRGGWTLHYADGCSLSHYGGLEQPMARVCMMLGVPIINTLTIPDEAIIKAINLPMVGLTGRYAAAPYGMFDSAPLRVVAEMYRELGAEVYGL